MKSGSLILEPPPFSLGSSAGTLISPQSLVGSGNEGSSGRRVLRPSNLPFLLL